MTLRKKTLLIIGLTLIGLIGFLYAASNVILLGSFAKLEEQATRRNVDRTLSALSDKLATLNTAAGDWALWDDTYTFVQDANDEYIKNNLVDSTFTNLGLNLMLFARPSGQVVYGKAFDLENGQEVPVPQGLQAHLTDDSPLVHHAGPESSAAGIVLLSEGPILVASRPILPSNQQGPIRGALIMGRYLDTAEIKSLAEMTYLSLNVERFDAAQLPPDFQAARVSLSEQSPIFIRPLNDQSIAGYALLKDIYGKPVLILRADMPREIHRQGRVSLSYLILSLVVVAAVFGAVSIVLLERQVLSRLTLLSQRVSSIGASGDPSARVAIPGRDELTRLADDINGMLEALERSQRERRESQKRYRDLVETSPDVIYSLSARDGTITSLNPAFETVTGWSCAEWLGKPFADIVHPDDMPVAVETFERVCRGETPPLHQLRILSKSGEYLLGEFTGAPQIEGGAVVGEFGIVRDVTERQRMEGELLRAQKLESIGILAGGIAHDFNNILTAVVGNIGLARALYANPRDDVFQRLTAAEKASWRAKDLTEQLLTFSKGGAPVKKTASIIELIKDSTSFVLRGSNVRCESLIPNDLWPVEVDEGQISQVINNLVINANEAMPEGGIIQVGAENVTVEAQHALPLPDGKYVKIFVKDQGVGIPAEQVQKVFDPYFTTKRKGSGLGLAVSYSIVKNHGGYITLGSVLGVGTAFYIYLPASQKEILAKPTVEEKAPAGKGKVLLMDDEDAVREVTGRILCHIGYQVGFARDGAEAIALYKEAKESGQPFDVVVMDLTIPGGMGGKETIRKLLEIDPQVKAVVSSGYHNDPIMAEFKAYSFSGVVAKPYLIEELSEVLQGILKQDAL